MKGMKGLKKSDARSFLVGAVICLVNCFQKDKEDTGRELHKEDTGRDLKKKQLNVNPP